MFKNPVLEVAVPSVDMPSFVLDGVPELGATCSIPNFTEPFLFSAERPELKRLSLIQLKHFVKCFAAGLRSQNFRAGDHVMLVSPNYIYSMIITLGTIVAGGIFCTAQPDLKVREYVDQMKRDEPKWLFVCNEKPLKENVLAAWKLVAGDAGRVWLFDECLNAEERASELSHSPASASAKSVPFDQLKFWDELLDLEGGPGYDWRHLTTEEECDAPCMLFTTSGTSGLRKAAMFSHKNLVSSWSAIGYRIRQDISKCIETGKTDSLTKGPRRILHTVSISRAIGTTLPLSFAKARHFSLAEVYFMSKTYTDMVPYLDRVQSLGIAEVSCAPFTLARLFVLAKSDTSRESRQYNFSELKAVTSVGAPASQSTLNGARQFLLANGAPAGLRVERALGMTEAGSLVSSWRMADEPSSLESCQGRVEPNMQVKIVVYNKEEDDSNVREAANGELGEIWVTGPSVIGGYYKNEAASREAFTKDGWFKSGDLGYLKGERLFLLDRMKDILKTPDNIPPTYIEGVLMEHPNVADAGVVGIYSPAQELQLVRAYIVKRPSSNLSEEEICSWMERESADTAHLTAGAEFLDELPRNLSGKLLRNELREKARKLFTRSDLTAMNMSSQAQA